MRSAYLLSNHVKLLFLVDIVGNIWVGKWVRSFMVIIRLITVHYSLTNSIISTLTLCRSHDANLCHDLWKDKLLRCWWWNINTHPLRLRWFPESLMWCIWQWLSVTTGWTSPGQVCQCNNTNTPCTHTSSHQHCAPTRPISTDTDVIFLLLENKAMRQQQ